MALITHLLTPAGTSACGAAEAGNGPEVDCTECVRLLMAKVEAHLRANGWNGDLGVLFAATDDALRRAELPADPR